MAFHSIIRHPSWFRHFYGVLNAQNSASVNHQFLNYVTATLPTLEAHTEMPATPLNSPINGEELCNVMESVKSRKATSLDDISNDTIKRGLPILKEGALLHVFNIVTSVQTFPGVWNVQLITPLHKKGDKLNADDYHGIIMSSCVGTIYLKIMTSRIKIFISTNNLCCRNQCGFKEDHRTEDNLFVLNTIYESHMARGQGNIYLAFVDFSKFPYTIKKIGYHISPCFLATSGLSHKSNSIQHLPK